MRDTRIVTVFAGKSKIKLIQDYFFFFFHRELTKYLMCYLTFCSLIIIICKLSYSAVLNTYVVGPLNVGIV